MLSRIKNKLKFIFPNTKKVFNSIYHSKAWDTGETISGPGSTLAYTAHLREQLPLLLQVLKIKNLLDAPCGDYNWMSKTILGDIDYTGADIVPDLIKKNKEKYPGVQFIVADILKDKLPAADAILCRDCFIHLQNRQVMQAIRNFKKNHIKYLITNTYPVDKNIEILTGYYRPVNLALPPFNLRPPLHLLKDHTEEDPIRYLGVWLLDEIT